MDETLGRKVSKEYVRASSYLRPIWVTLVGFSETHEIVTHSLSVVRPTGAQNTCECITRVSLKYSRLKMFLMILILWRINVFVPIFYFPFR